MKRLNKVLFTAALVIVAGVVMATGNLSVNISEAEGANAHVRVTNAVASHFEMEIRNANNDIIYYKQMQQPSKLILNTYDFSQLNDGEYTFTVKLDKEMNRAVFAVDKGEVKVVDQIKQVDPYFGFNNEQLNISYLNHATGDVRLYLYEDKTSRLIHEDDLGSAFVVNHAIDVSKLDKGNYSAVLESNNGTYQYDITLK